MRYTIRSTQTESGKGWRHELLRDGRLTTYAEYRPVNDPRVPARMQRMVRELNKKTPTKQSLAGAS